MFWKHESDFVSISFKISFFLNCLSKRRETQNEPQQIKMERIIPYFVFYKSIFIFPIFFSTTLDEWERTRA